MTGSAGTRDGTAWRGHAKQSGPNAAAFGDEEHV
jgi:hypothetical protein